MSYGWENSDEDEHATDAVARGGSLIRDKLLKELEAKDKKIKQLSEALVKHLHEEDKYIVELEAKDKEVEILETNLESLNGHLASSKRMSKNLAIKLEAKEKLIANSIPIGKIEAIRNNYMQFISDCGEDDSDRESAQIVFDVLEEILLTKGEG